MTWAAWYVRVRRPPRGDAEDVFWFATDLPGMPVQSLTRTDGQVVSETAIVDNTLP